MQFSLLLKQLSFLPERHHLKRWALGYYLVKIGFCNSIVQAETSLSYKQVRRIRADLKIKAHRRSNYGQDITSGSDLIQYSAALTIYCELRQKSNHLESVIDAYNISFKNKKDIDISGFYTACEEAYDEKLFVECVHCNVEIFTGEGLRDKLVIHRCPACKKTKWKGPSFSHKAGHISRSFEKGQQQSLF